MFRAYRVLDVVDVTAVGVTREHRHVHREEYQFLRVVYPVLGNVELGRKFAVRRGRAELFGHGRRVDCEIQFHYVAVKHERRFFVLAEPELLAVLIELGFDAGIRKYSVL